MNSSELLALSHGHLRTLVWRSASRLRRRVRFERPFSSRAGRRLLLVSQPDPISQSQTFPFHFYKDVLHDRWGYEVREIDYGSIDADGFGHFKDADVVCFQSWIDQTPVQLQAMAARLRRDHPRARLAFLDPCAPTDLRFASAIGAQVDLYVKKHVLRDRAAYGLPTVGHTNLSDWYGRKEGEQDARLHFPLPDGFFDKLLVGPSFVTAPYMLPRFKAMSTPPLGHARPFDVHARLGGIGAKDWYQRMRSEAFARVRTLEKSVRLTPGAPLRRRAYLRELARSKICFSPFGYGEVCWRDFEAVYAGALLVKPNMDHVETAPDLFLPGETYLPVRWDFEDLPSVVSRALGDEALRLRIVRNAWEAMRAYAASNRFVDQLDRLFAA
jgi:hypothetical protein